ncbi:polysaccharide deacetylase 2 family uncharacterized protein YibQ [Rhodovulum iodosum]|uniref:Polysaccharide deacetylase 2 family uncharacterized protein YibQ n=1 Tax=Rhodovulum iodosum TaxID=68291 RepID=A0ABV3XN50_9RHOB|nr:divergent polysaccharide deacetylase family protein [Rhodovulum robiginosum]RSK35877.1 divergent polysaccharide deacetylase family protein [Rhodovulum robiginosum]
MSRGFLNGIIWGTGAVVAGLIAVTLALPPAAPPGGGESMVRDTQPAPVETAEAEAGRAAPDTPPAASDTPAATPVAPETQTTPAAREPERTADVPEPETATPDADAVAPEPETAAPEPETAAPEAEPDTPAAAPASPEAASVPDAAPPDADVPGTTVETAIDLPAGSEFNRPPPDMPAQAPAAEPGPGTGGDAPGMARPVDDAAQPPRPDTAPASTPLAAADSPGALTAPDLPGAAPAGPEGEEPVLPTPGALGPGAPSADTAPVVVDRTGGPAPAPAAAAEDTAEQAADAEQAAEATGVRINRLPSITATPEPESAPEEADPAAAAEAMAEAGALARFATPVEAPGARPLFSIVMIDAGAEGLDRASLTTFAFPVTFAVDPTRPDAAEAMAAYRAAGYEVVALATGLPKDAEPKDVEVAMTRHLSVLSETVAVMDPAEAGLQSNRAAMRQLVSLLNDTGHGLITYDRGLNSAQQLASRAGVPATTVYRSLDAEREASPKIRRYLDRAVFQAAQDGAVVMVGHSYAETVAALYSWAQEDKAREVALVPISAILADPDDAGGR